MSPFAFVFTLEFQDGTLAEPPTFETAVPNWRAGDEIFLRPGRSLRVIGTRLDEGTDGDPVSVLVVEPA
jgi:hypothetical protein